ncbi:hypothetical protein BpHYR1_026207 [Brachionus plicatilis]|uniref:Uncharacterized protein n=1 Tax=Brachionus plicatilis TaxID=10195 RepID=A0A3M7QZM3_BRAPC|nr:hypothetical protein BpHYR1_026207 [Brachionus plicatilis]
MHFQITMKQDFSRDNSSQYRKHSIVVPWYNFEVLNMSQDIISFLSSFEYTITKFEGGSKSFNGHLRGTSITNGSFEPLADAQNDNANLVCSLPAVLTTTTGLKIILNIFMYFYVINDFYIRTQTLTCLLNLLLFDNSKSYIN